MGLARSTFYDVAPLSAGARRACSPGSARTATSSSVTAIGALGAALRHQGVVVNSKKLRRLMREHHLQPKRRRRYVVTTDSDHAGPIFPDSGEGPSFPSVPISYGLRT